MSGAADAATDPRADDAVAVFIDLCVSAPLGRSELKVDPSTLTAQKMDDAFTRKLNQDRNGGAAWGIGMKRSGAVLLVSSDPLGVCATRVAEADQGSIRTAFAAAVETLAKGEDAQAMAADRREFQEAGVVLTHESWLIATRRGGKVLLAITTSPTLIGMSQHMMTFSRAP